MLRVAIVDDEPLARRRLRRLASDIRDVDVVGEAGDSESAAALVDKARPHVVLLDVQMPGRDGFAVAAGMPEPKPALVFVTAYDRHAVRAFEIHAVDYLLKPVSRERLVEAIARARERVEARAASPSALSALLEHAMSKRRYLERLPVRSQGRIDLVDVRTIDWIGAADNYVTLHCGRRTHLLRETLANLERLLDPAIFVRVHRSAIARIDQVARLDAALRGDYDITLKDGTRLTLSRNYRRRFEEVIGRRV
ncbi:MAG TPA: LytTR family DNA-binding domain-containing protein [Vicinamibacterales bacterium]|nr:LytTR family DNA-binding domain-containing protein [Vicinamibacterales bacterium]